MQVVTNLSAIRTYRNLQNTNTILDILSRQLSSGYKFTSALENPAGMALHESFDTTIRVLDVAISNAQAGLGYYESAEVGYQQVSEYIKQMKEIAVRYATGTYSADDKAQMSQEFAALLAAISQVAASTKYNNTQVFGGSNVTLQIGDTATDTFTINLSTGGNAFSAPDLDGLGFHWASATGSATLTLSGGISGLGAISAINRGIGRLASKRTKTAQEYNRLQMVIKSIQLEHDKYQEVDANLHETDIAQTMIKYTSLQIVQQAGIMMLAQANVRYQGLLNLIS